MPDGSITLHIMGGGVELGLVVTVTETVRDTDTELLGVRVIERESVGVREEEGGTPIVPAKL